MCVMSTAALASGTDGNVIAAWETQKQIRFASLTPNEAASPTINTVPGTGERKHPAVAVNRKGEMEDLDVLTAVPAPPHAVV